MVTVHRIIACNADFDAMHFPSSNGFSTKATIEVAIVLTLASAAYADSRKAPAGWKKLADAALNSFMKKREPTRSGT